MDLGTYAQIALMKAQKENIEADTKKKEAEAGYTEGVQTDEAQARIKLTDLQSLTEEERKHAQLAQNRMNTTLAELYASNHTVNDKKLELMEEELQTLQRNNEIGEETKSELINQAKFETLNRELDMYVKEQGINLSKEQERKLWHDIWQGWTKAGLQGLDTIIKGRLGDIGKNLKDPNKSPGQWRKNE